VAVERADTLADGWRLRLDWQRAVAPDNQTESKTLEADRGYIRVTAVAEARPSWKTTAGPTPGACHTTSARARRCSVGRARPPMYREFQSERLTTHGA
jgi:ferric-dicitrate binding protein FerR (iron transport regulator)